MTRHALAAVTLLVAASAAAPQQQSEPPKLAHTSTEAHKCKACAPALAKAVAFLEKNSASADGYRHILMGFFWLHEGNHPDELKRSINAVTGGFYKGGNFNGNWATCMSAIFLSEVYKRQPTEKLRTTLVDILKVAESNMESTGGWCHHLGFAAESGYNKRGGGVDLGILTCMMYGAMLTLQKCGIEVNAKTLAKVQENLEGLCDGQGVCYGTDNKWGDIAMGRASWAWLGLAAGTGSPKLAKGIPQGLKSRYKETHQGHAYPPVHFHSVAMASHLLGPDAYNRFATHWIDRLLPLQKEDGSIELPHSEGKEYQKQDKFVGGTASFALILLLQQPGQMDRSMPKARKDVATSDAKALLGIRGRAFAGTIEVVKLVEKGPAEAAGLAAGDLIVEFRGRAIEKPQDLRAELDKCAPGQKVTLLIMHAGDRKKVEVKLGTLEPLREGDPVKAADDGELF